MLVLSRRPDEVVRIVLSKEDLEELLEKVKRENKPAELGIKIVRISPSMVRLGFDADPCFRIVRDELPANNPQEHRSV